MRWKTKDKTYGIQKPAQHFVSWFLRISVSPLCPPPPHPRFSLPSPFFPLYTIPFLPSLPSLPSFLFCTLSPPSSPTLPSLPSLPDIYLAYSSNSSTWRTILFPHTYRGSSPTITNLPCYNCYPLGILLSSTHSCFLLPSSTLYCPLSAFPCFFLHFLIVSSLFCISFSFFLYLFFLPLHSLLRFLLVPLHIPSSFLGKPATSPLFVVSFNLLSIFARVKRFNSPQKRSYHPGEMAPLRSPYDFDDEGNATSTSTTEPSSSGFRSSVTSRFTTTDASETYGDEDSSVPGV